MKAIVLGSGLIGSALKAELAERGIAAEVLGSKELDLTAPSSAAALRARLHPDALLFVASGTRSSAGPERVFARDAAMLSNIASAIAGLPLRACVYCSSMSVYGNAASDLRVNERTPVRPESLYALSKLAGEFLLARAARPNAPLLILRPPMVFGPGDSTPAYGPARLIRQAAISSEVRFFGDGSERRSYVFAPDLARAGLDLALGGHRGVFCVGPSESHSFQDIVARLRRIARKDIGVLHAERDRPRTEQAVDSAKLRAALPGLTFTDFERGLEKAYADFVRGAAEVDYVAV